MNALKLEIVNLSGKTELLALYQTKKMKQHSQLAKWSLFAKIITPMHIKTLRFIKK